MKQYLIIARSARALATSLKRAGHEVHCLDCFADVETNQLADSIQQLTYHDDGFDIQQVIELTRIYKTNYPNIEVIIGNGAELNPELIERLSEFVSVIGINADTIRQLKDPEYFSRLLSGLSIKHPRSSSSELDSLNKVLIKKKTGTGGTHIKWQQSGFKLQDGYYFQEYIDGKVLSAVFLADANRADVVGLNLQLQTARFEDMPFMYLGAIGSNVSNFEMLNRQQKTEIKDIVNAITKSAGLIGLCGLDFIVNNNNEIAVLEVNPRPPSTFQLHERESFLIEQHISCFERGLFEYQAMDRNYYYGYAILYANQNVNISSNMKWPDWVKDRPPANSDISKVSPVCSIYAQSKSIDGTSKLLTERLNQIESIIMSMQNAA